MSVTVQHNLLGPQLVNVKNVYYRSSFVKSTDNHERFVTCGKQGLDYNAVLCASTL